MWVDFHKILAKHLYAFNMFRFVSIRYDIDCCEECLPCVDDGMHQAIYLLYEINILFTLCFFRYITWCRFVFFEKKSLNFKNTKTNFVRSSTNAGKTQQSYMACCNRWGKEENIQNNRVRERNVKFFSRCMKMPALEWY